MSWAYSADPDKIHEIRQWPCLGVSEKEKDEVQVPTQFDIASKSWGYLVPREANPIKWFKLLLLRDEDIKVEIRDSPYLRDARRQIGRLGTDAVIDLIADYLRNLWEHSLREIEMEIDAHDVEDLPFKVAITIPAIWPQYARTQMKEAAKRAGIDAPRDIADTLLVLVEEPEAAALATLLERRQYPEIGVC